MTFSTMMNTIISHSNHSTNQIIYDIFDLLFNDSSINSIAAHIKYGLYICICFQISLFVINIGIIACSLISIIIIKWENKKKGSTL